MVDAASDLQRLLDERAIYQVLLDYARANDRLDLETYQSCFHSDANVHLHGTFDGPAQKFIEWVMDALRARVCTMHNIANHNVKVDGDIASSEAYGVAFLISPPPGDGSVIVGLRYVDRFERRSEVWRIAERWALREFTMPAPGLSVASADPSVRRDLMDLSYGNLRAAD